MTADVFDFQVELERRIGAHTVAGAGQCKHERVTLEPHGQIVRCRDCEEQLSAFWVLEQMTLARERTIKAREKERAELEGLREQTIHLKAARKVERLWRGKKLAPVCSHCSHGILPEDGLGDNCMSYQLLQQRRKKGEGD